MKNNQKTVCVAGEGLAGISAALTLHSLGLNVVVLDIGEKHLPKPGDALSAQALPILSKLKLLIISALHTATRINQIKIKWDQKEILHPWEGLLLERNLFEQQLTEIAINRGIQWHSKTHLKKFQWNGNHWDLEIKKSDETLFLTVDRLIEATGRKSVIVRALGRRHEHLYPLAAAWGCFRSSDNSTGIEIIRNKLDWWYISNHYGLCSVMIFSRKPPHTKENWLNAAQQIGAIHYNSVLLTPISVYPAQSSLTENIAGDGWIAVGDAAATFDPISSYGMTFALGSGYYAACALWEEINGTPNAIRNYSMLIYQKAMQAQITAANRYDLTQL